MAKRKIKKLKKLSDNKKENLCVAAVFGLIAVALVGASIMLLIENNGENIKNILNNNTEVVDGRTQEPQSTEPSSFPELENGEWIDCMPPLDDYEEKLCSEAEARGYKNIAY